LHSHVLYVSFRPAGAGGVVPVRVFDPQQQLGSTRHSTVRHRASGWT
jgi:hypothetical protein